MKFSIVTLFPEIFTPVLTSSILGRAVKKNLVEFELINLRDFGTGTHKTVDDRPFGGGAGMIIKADVLTKALKYIVDRMEYAGKKNNKTLHTAYHIPHTILMSASGKPFNQEHAKSLSKLDHIVLVCGHYEGVDQRFVDKYVDEELSIGDYVLTGGEIPAMVIVDSVTRILKGVLEKEEAVKNESFEGSLLEHPHFTRPEKFEGLSVPKILLSGNHQKISKWRLDNSLKKTKKVRPDLLKRI